MGQSPTVLLQPVHKHASFMPTRFTSGVRMPEEVWASDIAARAASSTSARNDIVRKRLVFHFCMFPRISHDFGAWINQFLLIRHQANQRPAQHHPVADPDP